MADMPLSPEVMVRSYPTPNDLHLYFTDVVSSKIPTYLTATSKSSLVRLKEGDLHPDQTNYPGVKLIYMTPSQGNEWVTRTWANDRAYADQDFFNWAVEYSEESVNCPVFVRRYLTPRATYAPATIGSFLSSVVNIVLTAGGTGFSLASPPVVSITGGGGSGATAVADINASGVIINIKLLAGGTGYTSNPSVTITGGSGATATASIQSQTAYLVKQFTTQAPDPYNSLYQYVTRIYETLPSPWMYMPLGVDPESLGVTLQKRRKNIAANIKVGARIYSGSSGVLTASISGGGVSSVAITTAGTGYGEIVQILFSAPPSPATNINAKGYALTTAGVITSVVISDPGTGYVSAPAVTILPKTLVVTERQDVTEFTAYEVVTVITTPPYYDQDHALAEYDTTGYQYPARINIFYLDYFGSTVGSRAPSARLILDYVYTWWVIAEEAPVPPFDEVIFDTIEINGITYSNVLHDGVIRQYNGHDLYLAGTTPTFAQYVGAVPLTGTSLAFSNGSTGVVGVGTSFLTQVQVGDQLMGWSQATVASITNDTNLVLAVAWAAASITVSPTNFIFVIRPSIAWIGNKKIIEAHSKNVKWDKFYRVQIVKVVMR